MKLNRSDAFKAHLVQLVLAALVILLAVSAKGDEKMDRETTSVVIQKLEAVLKDGLSDGTSGNGMLIRLGDLYAERARLSGIEEVEKNCNGCRGSLGDRKTALSYYTKALTKLEASQRGRVMLQMAHINRLLSRPSAAERLYRTIIEEGRRKHSGALLGQAQLSFGDFYYDTGRFEEGLKFYRLAAKNPETPRPGYARFRLGWCLLNVGQTEQAQSELIQILQNAELMDLDANGEVDKPFHSDVARDLATFLGRGKVTQAELDVLSQLSPAHQRLDNMVYLATESERIGMKESAVLAWNALFQEKDLTREQRLEGFVRLVQIYLDLNSKKGAVEQMGRTVELWKKDGCKDKVTCDELKARLRKTVTDWNKVEKKKLTPTLLAAYEHYVALFQDDLEMWYWGANVARDIKRPAQGIRLYHEASMLAAHQLRRAEGKAANAIRVMFEGSLLGEIELAEQSKDLNVRLGAYDHYLKMNPNGAKSGEVQYQKARTLYDMKRWDDAANMFYAVALKSKGLSESMRIQAADLALDALAVQKKDEQIEVWAVHFADRFKAREVEYRRLARVSVLNQGKTVIDQQQRSDYGRMLSKMEGFNLKTAPQDERLRLYRNRIILAERLENLDGVRKAAQQMVGEKKLGVADREWAMSKLLWESEMRLDFKRAYRLAKQMHLSRLQRDEKHLRLALLAELAGRPSRKHYEDYLNEARDLQRANLIRAKLIRENRRPWKLIDQNLAQLRRTPLILADVSLNSFVRVGDSPVLERVLQTKAKQTAPGVLLSKIRFIRAFKKFEKTVARHRISGANDGTIQRGLSARLALLGDTEQWVKNSVASNDWALQVLTLNRLGLENERLYKNLVQLPLPRGLKPQERMQYKKLLAQKAHHYKVQGHNIRLKLSEIWKNGDAIAAYEQGYQSATAETRDLIREEIQSVQRAAPRSVAMRLAGVLQQIPNRPPRSEIIAARADLKNDPFNERRAVRLRDLERQAGGEVMAVYLDGRLEQIKGATR